MVEASSSTTAIRRRGTRPCVFDSFASSSICIAPPFLRLEENPVGIGTVDGGVAHCAGLVLLGLIMERWNGRCRRIDSKGVAFKAQEVHIAALEQPWIGGAMGRMARNAALGFDRSVFPCKWARFICVACKAHRILRRCGSQLMGQKAAVRIVAVGAANQAFIYFMVKRLGEIRLGLQMAAIAESRQRRLQKLSLYSGMMDGVAIDASDIVLQVLRTEKVGVFLAEFMAA
jgi:hypothetical protein